MHRHPLFPAYLALISVCFFWGTTYLAIKMALEAFPPLLLISARFILSGSLMLAAALLLKVHLPKGRELALTALYGIVILGIGNGCLVFAEQLIPSGLAALFITTSPFWLVGIEALMPGGERVHLPTAGGMVVGFLGAAMLVVPGVSGEGMSGNTVAGFLILQFGCAAWCFGSVAQRRQPTQAHPVISGAIQQLATGLGFLIPALTVKGHPVVWGSRGVWAAVYLVIFGSIVGYSAYIYALDKLPISIVSIYNYINPVVAVFLGWLFYREPFGLRETLAMVIIFAGVGIVKRYARRH